MSLPGIGGLQGGVADPYKQTKAPKAKSKALIDQEITKKGEEKENIALVFKEDHYSKTNDERELKINAEDRLYRLKREPLFVSRGVDRQTEIINKLVLQDDRDRLRNDRNQILK